MSDEPELHRYSVYGMRVQSFFPLQPLLESEFEEPDIEILISDETSPVKPPMAVPKFVLLWQKREEDALLGYYWAGGGYTEFRYSMSPGKMKIIPSYSNFRNMIPALIGPAFGAALSIRGDLCLHGSVLALNGKAFIICGKSGGGKSSLSAALLLQGASFLSDDIGVIEMIGKQPFVFPGYPYSRIDRMIAEKLGLDSEQLTKVFPHSKRDGKLFLGANTFSGGFCGNPLPLTNVFFLEKRSHHLTEPVIQSITQSDSVPLFLKSMYGFGRLNTISASSFQRCSELVGPVKSWRFQAPDNLDSLSQCAATILKILSPKFLNSDSATY
ncbi:MAG: hypothetical protein WA705_30050 [Candidatus Ozemobacteraceae bacterium]